MPKRAEPAVYSIAAVSKLTGIGCHALRVWERRYGFPVPRRSPSGHRRYPADQVQRLDVIARRQRGGEGLVELMAEVHAGTLTADEGAANLDHEDAAIAGLIDALLTRDCGVTEAIYAKLVTGLSSRERVHLVLHPALVEVGERWFRGECEVYQEHAATEFLRQKLSLLIEEARANNPEPSRTALVGTVAGDRHGGGVLIVGLLLELAGWRATILGVDLPVPEIQKAVDRWHPDALCLSFVLSRNVNKRFDELSKVRGVPIYVGGRSILNYQGLARRHGLIPLAGPGETGVRRLIEQIETTDHPKA